VRREADTGYNGAVTSSHGDDSFTSSGGERAQPPAEAGADDLPATTAVTHCSM
jgi:hypothetical protein